MSFKFKTSITGKIANNGNTKEVEFAVILKYLSKFWRTLDKTLTNCEVNIILTWSEDCVITYTATNSAGAQVDPPEIIVPRD